MTGWELDVVAAVAAVAAAGLTAVGLVVAVCVGAVTRAWDPAVPVFLDLLLAGALLGLGATDSWRAIAGAAAVVVVRGLWHLGSGRRQAEARRA